MRARIAASVVLAAGILLGTSACDFSAPQATTIHYDASDGVSGDVGNVAIRNAILISDDGHSANLLVTLVNQGSKAQSLNVQYTSGSNKVTNTVTVEPNSSVTLGTPGEPSVDLQKVDTPPGALFPVYFQYGNETGVQLLIPVLDGTLSQYSTLGANAHPPEVLPPRVG